MRAATSETANLMEIEMADDTEVFIKEMTGRGWKADKTSGGHWKCTHPLAPRPVFTSGTPSDWRSFENFKAEIKRLEKVFDVVKKNNVSWAGKYISRNYEPEKGGGERMREVYEIACRAEGCTRTEDIRRHFGSPSLSEAEAIAKFRLKGWQIIENDNIICCSDCKNKQTRAAMEKLRAKYAKPEPQKEYPQVNYPRVETRPIDPRPEPEVRAKIVTPSLDMIRLIREIAINYEDGVGYRPGITDAVIAAKVGIEEKVVADTRTEHFGPARAAKQTEAIRAEATALLATLKALENDMMNRAAEIETKVQALITAIDGAK